MRLIPTVAIGAALLLLCALSEVQAAPPGKAGMAKCTGTRCSSAGNWTVGIGAPAPPTLDRVEAAATNTISDGDWVTIPDIGNHYPEAALLEGAEGTAELQCNVTVEGSLEACVVTAESPAELGFGKAALEMSPQFRVKPVAKNGEELSGKSVAVPVKFTLTAK
ncbi:hypothetical protein BH11PSE2_BH11PSE2_14650 [soil metagenome]